MTTIALNSASDRVLLAGRVKYCTDGPVVGRAKLYHNRIEISGLSLRGWHRRVVSLADVREIEWFTGREKDPNVMVSGKFGVLGFWVKGAGIWRFKIDELLSCKNDHERGIFVYGATG